MLYAPASAAPLSLQKVQKLTDGRGFTIVREGPFLVIGDESPQRVKQRVEGTIRWARTRLKASYFPRDPAGITIWLFANKRSYERHTRLFFGDTPFTPFGYYSPDHQALIMNISTGGGTLVHEMVHPYIAENFPDCPSWFNEGLGSLYEQSGERDNQIVGRTNWRLDGLQQAIRGGEVPSFRTLTHTTTVQFYDHDPGTNYSQARYLLYWLQEQGQLQAYYRAFRAGHKADPTGYTTLKAVMGVQDMGVQDMGVQDMAAFQKRWERWVLGLRFGG